MASPARRLDTTPEKSPQADIHRARLLLANMQRDRRTANDTQRAENDNAIPPGLLGDEPVLLELPTRSYTRPEPTEQEQERERQREMIRREEQFLYPGQEAGALFRAEGAENDNAAPEQAAAPATEQAPEPERQEVGTPDTAALAERERMAELERRRMEQTQRAERARASVRNRRAAKRARLRKLAQANKNGRRILKVIQLAAAETVLPLFTLIAQMNLETVNKWITKKRIPGVIEPEPNPKIDSDDVSTGLVNCCGCFLILLLFLLGFLLLWSAWFVFNPLDVAQTGIDLSL